MAMAMCLSLLGVAGFASEGMEETAAKTVAEDDTMSQEDETVVALDSSGAVDAAIELADDVSPDEDIPATDSADVETAENELEILTEEANISDDASVDDGAIDETLAVAQDSLEVEVTDAESVGTLYSADVPMYAGVPTIDYGETDYYGVPCYQIQLELIEYYSYAYEVLDLINEERATYGLGPVVMDETLLESSMQRAAETAMGWSHVRCNGNSFSTKRFRRKYC
jgi:hypothetical protein